MDSTGHLTLSAGRKWRVRLLTFLLLPSLTTVARAYEAPVFQFAWGSLGSGPGQFNMPWGVAVSQGIVYVVDSGNGRIQRFDTGGAWLSEWGSPGTGPGQFREPGAIAIDASGFVYVADYGNHRVQKFTSAGDFVSTWGEYGSGDGQFSDLQGIAVDSQGHVLATDGLTSRRVEKFTADGTFLSSWGTHGHGPGQFFYPFGIAADRQGNVYVTDLNLGRVDKFTNDGAFLLDWTSAGTDGSLSSPQAIAVDAQDHVYVGDFDGLRMQVFSNDGTFLAAFGARGSGPGQFEQIGGVAADGDAVYMVDYQYHRVVKYGPYVPHPVTSPKLLLHLATTTMKNACAAGVPAACAAAVTNGGLSTADGPFHFLYLLAARGTMSSLAGLQCGISYESNSPTDVRNGRSVDVFGWTLCATLEFPTPAGNPPGASDWPGPGAGNMITWDALDNCQTGELAVAGYFYMAAYDSDVFRLTPRPVDGLAKLADCVIGSPETMLAPEDLGFVTFSAAGTLPGCNPCTINCALATPVLSTTWGDIKTLFQR